MKVCALSWVDRLSELAMRREEAWGDLWKDMSPKVLGYYRRMSTRQEDAEDLLMIWWQRVLAGLSREKGFAAPSDKAFYAWLWLLARREFLRQFAMREPAVIPLDGLDSPAAAPESLLFERLTVEGFLDRLPPREREVVALTLANLSLSEVAQVLEDDLSTVKMRYYRAVLRLKDLAGK